MSKEKNPERSEHTGLSAKEIAAITACVPCSGTPYIDAIITQGLRFRTATAAMVAIVTSNPNCPLTAKQVAEESICLADALIAAFRVPKDPT